MAATRFVRALGGAVLLILAGQVSAARIGQFDAQQDIGATALHGGATFEREANAYRVTGGGANIWANEDAFHFVWTRRSGDLHVAADIAFAPARPASDPHRKAGLMIRQNLTPGSPYADVMVHGSGLVSLQWRDVQDGPTHQLESNVEAPRRIRLEREGDYVYFSVAGAGWRAPPCWRQLPDPHPRPLLCRPRASRPTTMRSPRVRLSAMSR